MTEPSESKPGGEKSHAKHDFEPHVVPLYVLLAVFAALLIMTWLTVTATRVDLGRWNLGIAMGIATIKAALVALYFMHLRYDSPFYGLLFLTGLLFVLIFISITLLDTLRYQPDTNPWTQTVGYRASRATNSSIR